RKSWVQSVGEAEQLERRTYRDRSTILALEQGRADHVDMVSPWHDIERLARMEKADGPRQRHLWCVQNGHLATNAAQVRQVAARREPTAVDHHATTRCRHPDRLRHRISESERGAHSAQLRDQVGQGRPRGEVALLLVIEPAAEPSGEIRLELRQLTLGNFTMALGDTREAVELPAVPAADDDQ